MSKVQIEVECVCDTGPGTEGPAEECPAHGRPLADWIERGDVWHGRFDRMRQAYRERFNEGLSDAEWHRKHCAAMRAVERIAERMNSVHPNIGAYRTAQTRIADLDRERIDVLEVGRILSDLRREVVTAYSATLTDDDDEPVPDRKIVTWEVEDLTCPECQRSGTLLGYRMDNQHGEHMHTHYVCTYWPSGAVRPCGWHGWVVPGWDAVPEPEPEPLVMRRCPADNRLTEDMPCWDWHHFSPDNEHPQRWYHLKPVDRPSVPVLDVHAADPVAEGERYAAAVQEWAEREQQETEKR